MYSYLHVMGSGPAFTLEGDIITEVKTGSTGRVYKKGNSHEVEQLAYQGKPGKEQVLYKRMASWYFYIHIQKSVE